MNAALVFSSAFEISAGTRIEPGWKNEPACKAGAAGTLDLYSGHWH
ncbi:hypothetical protein X759_15220 [Mesorhizobium sp. LSHC420B00]|nr:hypothetical protein X759_15220 [Mesorhizobium sp. LSHC420B00]